MLAIHLFLVTACTRFTWPHKLTPLYNNYGGMADASFVCTVYAIYYLINLAMILFLHGHALLTPQ